MIEVIGWSEWDDVRWPDGNTDEHIDAAIKALREKNYHWHGDFYQGYYGAPVFNDGTQLHVSKRTWGGIMAEAYPDEVDNSDNLGYCEWAWFGFSERELVLPSGNEIIA